MLQIGDTGVFAVISVDLNNLMPLNFTIDLTTYRRFDAIVTLQDHVLIDIFTPYIHPFDRTENFHPTDFKSCELHDAIKACNTRNKQPRF